LFLCIAILGQDIKITIAAGKFPGYRPAKSGKNGQNAAKTAGWFVAVRFAF
jgi:hypothetical protein